jgi:RNA polymerase sigma-70 factor (ECF subfamily)
MEFSLDEKTDSQLVAAFRGGSRDAYAALVRRHSRCVYAICLGILGSISDSEDITQEVFMKGMMNIQKLRDASRFPAWISQIARNSCWDYLRARNRRQSLLDQNVEINGEAVGDFYELHAALEKLPEMHRLPLMLYYFDGQSSDSVARTLQISRAGACTRLSRARKALRKLLEKQAGIK